MRNLPTSILCPRLITAFFRVEVEAIQIEESPPDPLLILITGPSEEAMEAGDTKNELGDRQILRKRFRTQLPVKAKHLG